MSGQFRFLQCIYKSIPAGVHSSWRKWQILFNMMIEKSEGTNKKFSKVGNKGLSVFGNEVFNSTNLEGYVLLSVRK